MLVIKIIMVKKKKKKREKVSKIRRKISISDLINKFQQLLVSNSINRQLYKIIGPKVSYHRYGQMTRMPACPYYVQQKNSKNEMTCDVSGTYPRHTLGNGRTTKMKSLAVPAL